MIPNILSMQSTGREQRKQMSAAIYLANCWRDEGKFLFGCQDISIRTINRCHKKGLSQKKKTKRKSDYKTNWKVWMQINYTKRFANRLSQNDILNKWNIWEISVYLLLNTMARYTLYPRQTSHRKKDIRKFFVYLPTPFSTAICKKIFPMLIAPLFPVFHFSVLLIIR